MRDEAADQATMLTAVTPDAPVPQGHPVRRIKSMVDSALGALPPMSNRMYASIGRPSIPPEHLLKGCLPMALFSVRSERQFFERLVSKPLVLVGALLLVVACGGAATSIPEPTPTATPIPAPEPTPTTTATATPLPPAEQTDRLRDLGDPRLTDIREKLESVEPVWTVYFHSEDWRTPGRNTLINDVFELVKLENIATHDGYKEISPETVVALEPDIIVADSIESIVENPDLSGLHMVQDTDHIPHHIFVLSEGLSFSFDNPRFMKAVKELAVFSYPAAFPDEEKAEEDGHTHAEGETHSH